LRKEVRDGGPIFQPSIRDRALPSRRPEPGHAVCGAGPAAGGAPGPVRKCPRGGGGGNRTGPGAASADVAAVDGEPAADPAATRGSDGGPSHSTRRPGDFSDAGHPPGIPGGRVGSRGTGSAPAGTPMIGSTRQLSVYAHAAPTDMRKSFDTLSALVTQALKRDPLSGDLFLFVSKNRKRAKVLMWD